MGMLTVTTSWVFMGIQCISSCKALKKNLHLIYAFLPSHIELFLLLETLGTNCTKEPSLKAFCGVHHFCNCIMCFFVVLSDKDIKLTNIEEMYALFEM